MASPSNTTNTTVHHPTDPVSTNTTTTTMHHPTDPVSTNTTFVQADPSTFRTIVQQLTGASDDPSSPKLPLTHPARPAAASDIGLKKPVFKLHERRRAMNKLEIKLNNNNIGKNEYPSDFFFVRKRGSFLVSPVSTLDFWSRGGSESTRSLVEEEEEKAIAEKGFYLHPSPLNTPRAGAEPELLPLFPLHTPKESSEHDYDATSSSK